MSPRKRKKKRKAQQERDQVELLPDLVERADDDEGTAADTRVSASAVESDREDVESGSEGAEPPPKEDVELARTHGESGRKASAARQGASGPTAAPRPAGDRLARARDLVQTGRVPEAIALYEAILSENPANLKAHNNLGALLDELGEHERAVEHFEAALELEVESVEVLTNLGSALTELGRYDEADELLQRAQRISPGALSTRLAVGVLSFRRGLYEQAEAELRGVCERDAEHGLAHYYRGESLNRLGRFEESAEVMTRASELLPADPRPFYTLGHLLDRRSLRAEASEMYRRARDLQARAMS